MVLKGLEVKFKHAIKRQNPSLVLTFEEVQHYDFGKSLSWVATEDSQHNQIY